MNENRKGDGINRKPGSDPGPLSTGSHAAHVVLTGQLQKYMHALGPTPKRCLETFADLGLSDAEIGRYFRVPHEVVTQLRAIWNIDGTV